MPPGICKKFTSTRAMDPFSLTFHGPQREPVRIPQSQCFFQGHQLNSCVRINGDTGKILRPCVGVYFSTSGWACESAFFNTSCD